MVRRPDGALEHDVLNVLWDAERALAPGEVGDRLDADYAYTSVATILTRLLAKGLVTRHRKGKAFAYRAVVDEPDLAVQRITELLETTSDRSQVLARFVGGLSAGEAAKIRALLDQTERGRPS